MHEEALRNVTLYQWVLTVFCLVWSWSVRCTKPGGQGFYWPCSLDS